MLLRIVFTLLAATTIVHSNVQLQQGNFCQPIEGDSVCKFPANTGYSLTRFPNNDHRTQKEAMKDLSVFHPLIKVQCHADFELFICSHYLPLCIEKFRMTLKPCRSLCESARKHCKPLMERFSFNWPFNCTIFPESSVACVSGKNVNNGNETTTPATNVTMVTEVIDKTIKNKKRKRGMFCVQKFLILIISYLHQ